MRFIRGYQKTYKHNITTVIFHDSKPIPLSSIKPAQAKKIKDDLEKALQKLKQRKRTYRMFLDYALSNDFTWFATYTFKNERYDHALKHQQMQEHLRYLRKKVNPDIGYLGVPELHRDGAVHFHILFTDKPGRLSDSGISQKGKPVFNSKTWSHGFSNITYIKSTEATAYYTAKYLIKTFMEHDDFPLPRRFFRSRNLNKVKTVIFDDEGLFTIDFNPEVRIFTPGMLIYKERVKNGNTTDD